MKAGTKQRLVRIDIAHAAQEALVEQQRLDAGAACLGQSHEFRAADLERIRSALRVTGSPEHLAKFSYVVVAQHAFIEQNASARKLAAVDRERELAGHAKVYKEHATGKIEHDEFAVAAYLFDAFSDNDFGSDSFDAQHDTTGQDRAQATDNGFYFG